MRNDEAIRSVHVVTSRNPKGSTFSPFGSVSCRPVIVDRFANSSSIVVNQINELPLERCLVDLDWIADRGEKCTSAT